MFRHLKLLIFLFTLFLTSNVNAKPVPPGAGDGDVAANILILVDSSASMGRWIGGDGLGAAWGVTTDSQDRILIGQNARRTIGAVVRYTTAGTRDGSFRPIRTVPGAGCSVHLDATRNNLSGRMRKAANVRFVENLEINGVQENVIFMAARDRLWSYVLGFSEDGRRCLFAVSAPRGYVAGDFDIQTVNNVPYLIMAGHRWGRRAFSYFKSCNLQTMQCAPHQPFTGNHVTRHLQRLSVANDLSRVYFTNALTGNLEGYSLIPSGGAYNLGNRVVNCPASINPTLSSDLAYTTGVRLDPSDNNIIYTTSRFSHAVQKIQISGSTCSVITHVGSGNLSNVANGGSDPGDLAADNVNFNNPWGLHITNNDADNKIYTATRRGYVDEFDKSTFTLGSRNSSWQKQMGGPRVRRWDGVKAAINAIVNDTTLTTGAYFGFGHWNAGMYGRGRTAYMGGRHCHRNDDCFYYQNGWDGDHPDGTSKQCNEDSCLNVGVSAKGANLIMSRFGNLGMAWGTDARAFSEIALEYFKDSAAGGSIVDKDSECQLNYVIVIGDGAMNNVADAEERMAELRELGVKSLYVAYGGGITGTPLQKFHDMARIGSSTATTTAECDADPDCEKAIIADTPTDLKTALTSKIRQIIADKLAFTAPSITASIQEGGSIYQAQFAYEQYGEWRGTILRKTLNPDGTVDHSMDTKGNWNAAVEMKKQSKGGEEVDSRYIWSAMAGAPYLGNWDNFNVANYNAIRSLFDRLGYAVQDYHNSSSKGCKKNDDDPLSDELRGLINFMKGNDYFDYDSDCDLIEVRDHVMGDVYHSQLIEVGAPEANIQFSGKNEEAYYRATRGYERFMGQYSNRKKIIYAGANSGMLHAFDAVTGKEEWAFIPPFVGALIPQIINPDYNQEDTGGTNPIFGVDGSPVIHDVFIRGYDQNGNLEGSKSWRTLLMIPYGRGGPGFSVLDITAPIPVGGKGPIHMFSVFNDKINQKILVADVNGFITEYEYNATSSSLLNSAEGSMATDNFNDAKESDDNQDPPSDLTPAQDAIESCQTMANFRDVGTNSCYTGEFFHFPELSLPYDNDELIPAGILSATELIGDKLTPIKIASAKMVADGSGGSILKVQFDSKKTFNASAGTSVDDEGNKLQEQTNNISVAACKGGAGIDAQYDYTTMGETWSTPKIIRMPTSAAGNLESDRYVAVMGGGMGRADQCAGSSIFLVDLEGHVDGFPGRIFGAEVNGGPITIVDTNPAGVTAGTEIISTPNGSNIPNAIPASPVVITPDTAPNIPWRGALVYINDLEGKVTKINLSNNTKGYSDDTTGGVLSTGVTELYDQTTLFRLNASEENARYSYFQMEAGLGVTNGGFWLFGSTGNFTDLGGREPGLDNILYGVRDVHYPYWRHLNGVKIPKAITSVANDNGDIETQINSDFIKKAHKGANDADNHVAASPTPCVNVTGDDQGIKCPSPTAGQNSWVIHLERETVDTGITNDAGSTVLANTFYSPRTFRKASAPPTLFRGQVYFPIYQPPPGIDRCNQGHAFICVADDECGTNNSAALKLPIPPGENIENPDMNACAYVREGVLSELVVFGDDLFANVAGPSDDESTLFTIPSIPGEIISNKGGWRDSSF